MRPSLTLKSWLRCTMLLIIGATHLMTSAQRLPIQMREENFSGEALARGVVASELECSSISLAAWSRADTGEAECIRYWASGLVAGQGNPRVMIYIPGDQLAGDQPVQGYTNLSPSKMQALVDQMALKAGVPLILLARPGSFGSSGEHKKRRRILEPQLVSKALDVIKTRHGIQELTVVGLSGGGHTLVSFLGWRSDITCAVPASSVSSPKMRWEEMGLTADLTGYADSYEPLAHLKSDVMHPKLRVFVLGDPKDSSVKWSTQLPLATRLKELGVNVEILTGEGSDSQHHALGASGRLLGSLCLLERPTSEILNTAAKGLKG